MAQHELQRELKLRQLIIEHFIPPAEAAKVCRIPRFPWALPSSHLSGDDGSQVQRRAQFDAGEDAWVLQPLALSDVGAAPGSAVPGRRRPLAEHAVLRARVDRNPRYRDENIVLLDLDLPDRTTEDYTAPTVDPRVQVRGVVGVACFSPTPGPTSFFLFFFQAALDDALRDEADLTLDASKPVDFVAACAASCSLCSPRAAHLLWGFVSCVQGPQGRQKGAKGGGGGR